MLKTQLKAVGLLACLVWFNLASAASLGGINVTSALGHPLKAEISLAELGKTDKATFVAKMASVNEFKSAGLDYPYSLPKLSFEVNTRANGEAYLKLTSIQPVNEPFVSILIELSWPSGKLLREYTFLLDPAGFAAEQPKVAEVKPVEPMLPSVAEHVPAVIRAEPAPVAALPFVKASRGPVAEQAAAKTDMASAELAPAEAVKVEALASSQHALAATGSILVEQGDTLGKIADEIKPVDVSIERMLVAMYRANAQTFDGKNMNRIKAGKILRMPEAAEIENVTQQAAVKEIRAQVADWQDYRQKLAATQSTSAEQAPKQEVAGKVSAAVAEKAPTIKETAKEVLRLSKGESLGDKTIPGGGAKSKQETLTAKADDAAAKDKQLQEEKKKITKLEEINKEASKLVELKGLLVAPVETKAVEKVPAGRGLTAMSAVPASVPAAAELNILETINEYLAILLEDPMLLGAGVAVLLGLGGLGFVKARRGKGGQEISSTKRDEIGAASGTLTPSPDTGDFTGASVAAAPMSVAAALDDVDPISEADLFLSFGRDAQAEEILKDALVKKPSNIRVKLKLLSIYTNRKDSKTFAKYAQEIKDSGNASAWERAAVMGREVDPSNPSYVGTEGKARTNRVPPKAEVDFDLGLGKTAEPAYGNAIAAKDFKMDFDVTDAPSGEVANPAEVRASSVKSSGVTNSELSADVHATSILSRELAQSAQTSTPMDFDVTGILSGDVNGAPQSNKMDFDLSGSNLEIPAGANKSASSTAMDFDLSGKLDSTSGKPETAKKLDIDFGDINFNLDEDSPPVHAGGEGKGEQWHEVATKLDLAKAYQEMGDADGAREILNEVLGEGDVAQRELAEKLLQQLAV